jgi:hypothetical protein
MLRRLLIAGIGVSVANISPAQELLPTPTVEPTWHKPGETVSTWSFGSASEWLHLFIGMAPFMASSLVLGAIIGVVVPHHHRIRVPTTIIASVALYALIAWWYYDPNEWSWSQPVVSALYQVAPVVWFFVTPSFLGCGIVRWIRSPLPRPSIWKHLTRR